VYKEFSEAEKCLIVDRTASLLDEISIYLRSSFSGRKGLEQRTYQDDERIATLEQQLAEAQLIAEDSDRKYDEVIGIFLF
jgi:aconitase B